MPTEKAQMIALFEKLGVCYNVEDDPFKDGECPALDSKIHVPPRLGTFGLMFAFDKDGTYLGLWDVELSEFYPRGSYDGGG